MVACDRYAHAAFPALEKNILTPVADVSRHYYEHKVFMVTCTTVLPPKDRVITPAAELMLPGHGFRCCETRLKMLLDASNAS